MSAFDELDYNISWRQKDFRICKPESSTPLNVIFDIDLTMVKTYKKIDKLFDLGIYTNPKLYTDRKRFYRATIYDTATVGSGDRTEVWGVKRPGLMRFLHFSSCYFKHIFIWTSGLKDYAREMKSILFQDLPPPTGVLDQSFCEKKKNGDFYKPLWKLYDAYGHLGINEKNTIMIDDLDENMLDNPDNGIIIPAYEPRADIDQFRKPDNAFEIIQNWLETDEVKKTKDIRKVVKPFSDKWRENNPRPIRP